MRREGTFADKAVTGFRKIFPNFGHGLYTSYVLKKYDLYWGLLRNPPSRRQFKRHLLALSEAQRRVVRDLSTHGIASIHFDELGIDRKQWDRLRQMVDDFTSDVQTLLKDPNATIRAIGGGIDPFQHNRDRLRRFLSLKEKAGGDDYLLKLYPEAPTFELNNPLLRIVLDEPVLNVVNSYFGLWARLTYADVWHTIPIDVGQPVGSQHWHRDSEDRRMVKIYLYFSEVDAGTGPLQYVRGSALGGPYEDLWRWRAAGRIAPSDADLEQQIPASEWITGTGSPGTVIFCDTSGLHRGGTSRTGPRIAATCTFVTPASLFLRRFIVSYNQAGKDPELSKAAKFALADPLLSLP
jgi:Phytanoyl-CoA dioxygenase (PhyH)